jgi:hypothetical protein
MADGTHPTRAGVIAISQAAVDAMIPEPASGVAAAVAIGSLALSRRRRDRI